MQQRTRFLRLRAVAADGAEVVIVRRQTVIATQYLNETGETVGGTEYFLEDGADVSPVANQPGEFTVFRDGRRLRLIDPEPA